MTQRTNPEGGVGTTLLPAGASLFLRRRAKEGLGLLFALSGTLLILALISYNSADPSWSTATDNLPENLIGLPGASISDFLLQILGIASYLVPLILFSWSWIFFSHKKVPYFWWSILAIPLALCNTSGFAATLNPPELWQLDHGFGGWLGDEILQTTLSLGALVLPSASLSIWQILLGFLSLSLLAVSFGLSFQQWKRIIQGLYFFLTKVLTKLLNILIYVYRLLSRNNSKPERTDPRFINSRKKGYVEESHKPISVKTSNPSQGLNRVSVRPSNLRTSKRAKAEQQTALDLGGLGSFRLPQLSLLKTEPSGTPKSNLNEFALEQNARLLETVMGEFGVRGEIAEVNPGPVVTRYELDPAPGTKTSRVIGLADDIARSMSAVSARVAVITGQNRIGIELPNALREVVYLRQLLSTPEYESTSGRLSLALGKNIAGEPVIADLARMPHMLIAGTTGSGKSVAVNTMILSLLYRLPPEQCRLILIDPKMLELSVYDGIPHLLTPVVTEPGKAVVALKWVVREMQNRYRAMSRLGVRNLSGYNERVAEARKKGESPKRTVQTGYDNETGQPVYEEQDLDLNPMPFIVVVVDEMADLMMVAGKDVEIAIQRLSQMARAAGIHLIMATQRPSVDVITGTIKANFPTRISFQVTSKIDSRTILGEQGAEQLLGQGDMLFLEAGGKIQRVHGPFVSDPEVERVVRALKEQGKPEYLEDVTEESESEDESRVGSGSTSVDELYDEAVALILREQRASTSFVQRHLQVGYNRAARMIEQMEAEGVVSPPNRVGKREVLPNNNV